MQRGLEFLGNHPILFSVFILLVVAYFYVDHLRSGKKISPQSLGSFVNTTQAKLIDIRDAKDFKAGHIVGSQHIPYSQLKDSLAELQQSEQPVVVICKLGQTAGMAAQQIGGEHVYRLDGGILGWQSAGLPLVKPKNDK